MFESYLRSDVKTYHTVHKETVVTRSRNETCILESVV